MLSTEMSTRNSCNNVKEAQANNGIDHVNKADITSFVNISRMKVVQSHVPL